MVGAGTRINDVHVGQRQHINHHRVAVAATQGIRSRYNQYGIVVERRGFHFERGSRSGGEVRPVDDVLLRGRRHGEFYLVAVANVKRVIKREPVFVNGNPVFGYRTLAMGVGISVGMVNGILRDVHYRTVLNRIVAGIHRIAMDIGPQVVGQGCN